MKTFELRQSKTGKTFAFCYYSYNGEMSSRERVKRANVSRHLDALHACGFVMRIDAALS